MFGLDLLFDFNKNGKMDAFEWAAQLDFLDTVDSNLQTRRSGKHKATYDSDIYDDMDEEGN